ncbi:phosphotransferase [Paenibacillus melissococcoides]|uniref:Phosphotransferase n=2 Tax=Paenibacillus TaxID=44249 RepID=A0ABM9G2I8_9BACL|nr:phosphotransferase [Paenibacillus melissococcoides]
MKDRPGFCDALGRLQQLSSEYVPATAKCWPYLDVLGWIEGLFIDSPQEEAALAEAGLLREHFASLPVTKHNFGLVHYDFEYDNVFYDQTTHSCHVIDFDDAMYHWYAMDIEQALASLRDCLSPYSFNSKKQCF